MGRHELRLPSDRITVRRMSERAKARFRTAQSDGVLPTDEMEAVLETNDVSKLPPEIEGTVGRLAEYCDGDVGEALWRSWFAFNFNHLFRDASRTNLADLIFDVDDLETDALVPLFNTESVNHRRERRQAVNVRRGGRNDRPLLERSQEFEAMIEFVGRTVAIQYGITNDDDTADGAPFFSDESVRKILDFVDDYAWVYHDEYDHRMPVSSETPLDGFLYLLYTLDEGSVVPKYVGIAKREREWSGNLNDNIANAHQDSKRGRWGDGYNNHVGGLSLACFRTPEERDPKPKYVRWMNDLFLTVDGTPQTVDGRPILRNEVYIDVSPWFDHDVERSETNAIKLAYNQFPEELLNDRHTG